MMRDARGHTYVVPGVVESLKIITEKASTRICRFAFDYAKKHGRKKVSAVHKANIMKFTDGLWYKESRAVAAAYGAYVFLVARLGRMEDGEQAEIGMRPKPRDWSSRRAS